jgi:hypothetical protein
LDPPGHRRQPGPAPELNKPTLHPQDHSDQGDDGEGNAEDRQRHNGADPGRGQSRQNRNGVDEAFIRFSFQRPQPTPAAARRPAIFHVRARRPQSRPPGPIGRHSAEQIGRLRCRFLRSAQFQGFGCPHEVRQRSHAHLPHNVTSMDLDGDFTESELRRHLFVH